MTYEEDVREALKQGPGSVKQIMDRIPRASESGVRKAIYVLKESGEVRIARFEMHTNYAYATICEAIPKIVPWNEVHYRGHKVSFITSEECDAILDSGPHYVPLGLYITQDTIQIPGTTFVIPFCVAVDNSTGDAWTEDFYSATIAKQWLVGMLDTEEAHAKDYQNLTRQLAPLLPLRSESEAGIIREWVAKRMPEAVE